MQLHTRAAKSEVLPPAARLQQWLSAGHLLAACEFALTAAAGASAAGDDVLALELCERVQVLLDRHALTTVDTARLTEHLQRIRSSSARPLRRADEPLSEPSVVPMPADPVTLSARVEQADRLGRVSDRIATRLAYVTDYLIPARELDVTHRLLREIDPLADDLADRARVEIRRHLPDVLLGRSALAEPAVSRLAAAVSKLPPEVAHDVCLLDCLIAHHLGRRDLSRRMSCLGRPGRGEIGLDDATVAARILAMRERFTEAQTALDEAPTPTSPLARQLRGLAEGQLATRLGRTDTAITVLRHAQEVGFGEDCHLLMPEITARLIALIAPTDLDSVYEDFEVFDSIIGTGRTVGAESVYRLVARSAIRRAAGQIERALEQLVAATELAVDLEFPLLAGHCHLGAAECLSTLDRPGETQMHQDLARRYFRQAGVLNGPSREYGMPLTTKHPTRGRDPRSTSGGRRPRQGPGVDITAIRAR
ncbi:MAG: hypothetical protein H0V32_08145 [Nocardioidaceae bacterium]|nr:hypothetical protein [Nocardioidaceae bacterium]